MGGGRRGSGGSKGGRLAAGWWSHLNTAYRSYLTEHGQKPERPWLEEWFEKHAKAAWPNGDQPSIQAAWDHCKCLRTLDQARDYFRQYRAKKKDERDGGPVRASRKRNVDTDETPSEELDEDEGESSSQEDDDDNNGGPNRQRSRKAPPPRRKSAPKNQPAAQEEGPNPMSMMQFQNMLMQQQQAMNYPQMMMGGYQMASDPSSMMMGGLGGGMNGETFNTFPFQIWQQQQQMLAMMMAQQQQQVQASGNVGDANELAQQQQSLAAAMMMAQQQQMAMMLHLHQQHALSQGSLEQQRPPKEEDVKVTEEDGTAPVDEGKEGSEANKDIPPPLPPPPPNPILGPVVMFPAAYASTVIPPYPALSTYGFDCSSYSSTIPSAAVPSLFMKTSPQATKASIAGSKSQISAMSTEDRLMPRQGISKGEEDSGTSDPHSRDGPQGFAKRKKRSSSSETMADENGMPLPHTRPQRSHSQQQQQQQLPFTSSLDTLIAAAEAVGSKSEE